MSAFRRSDLITFNTAGRIAPESRAILRSSILSLLLADQPGVVLAGNARALVWWDWSLHYVWEFELFCQPPEFRLIADGVVGREHH